MTVVVPDLAELFEEAYERVGLEMRSGYDLRTIRRSLIFLHRNGRTGVLTYLLLTLVLSI